MWLYGDYMELVRLWRLEDYRVHHLPLSEVMISSNAVLTYKPPVVTGTGHLHSGGDATCMQVGT